MQTPPKHLKVEGKTLWKSLVSDYEISDSAGITLVTTACECLDRMREAQQMIKKHGIVSNTGAGGLKTNPACKVELDSRNGLYAALRALNLDLEPLRDRVGRPAGEG